LNVKLHKADMTNRTTTAVAVNAPGVSRWTARVNLMLAILVALCLMRLWIVPLPSSFWVDEMATAFVVQHGAHDPTLQVAPQVAASIYYALPRMAERILGFSEISYRIPSLLAMLATLFLIAKIAARLIHPDAAWFAVFLCLVMREFNTQAADARPYALANFVLAASLWLLIRWLDSARWADAALFVIAASLVWRVHLVLWPMYVLFALYAIVRLARHDSEVGWARAGVVFAALAVSLIPVLIQAMALNDQASAHVVAEQPGLGTLFQALKLATVAGVCAGCALLARWLRWAPGSASDGIASASSLCLIAGWWLVHPLSLFLYSLWTHHSLFLARYLNVALPGVALVTTAVAALFVPARYWKPVAVVLGLVVLVILGRWNHLTIPHHNSDWRGAARTLNQITDSSSPVICPSPFIEARDGVWRPDYPISSFLYSHLLVYRLVGRTLPFPFQTSRETEQYASTLAAQVLSQGNRFAIYGGEREVKFWQQWFAARPELSNWRNRRLGPFADVEVALFENPEATRITSK
jgi:Dolichyl-phosphate-mannose-protein mannosyltransferase